MQEARSATTSLNMTIKRPSDTSETDRKPKLMDRLCEAQRARRLALAMGLPAGEQVEEHENHRRRPASHG